MTVTSIPAYRRLAQQIQNQIGQGTRQMGDKMPSLRQFSQQHAISMTTAIRCYEQLQESGYLTARAKSGFYINLPLNQQKTLEFAQFNGEVKALPRTKALSLNTSESTFSTAQLSPELMPAGPLQRCINRVLRRQNKSQFLYGNPQGSQTLRETLALHFSKQGLSLHPQNLMITGGCIDAVTLALEVITQPGDTIAITSPCYNGLLQLLALLNRKVIELPSTPEGLDLAQLEALAKQGVIKACLITANHQNPTGHSLCVEQKRWLADFASTMKVPIIEDDVFCELSHQGPMSLPIKAWDSEGWVIWCNSISKTLAPGLRLGWCQGGRFLDEMVKQRYLRTMGINQPLQEGLSEFINSGHYTRHLTLINSQLRQQSIDYHQYLTDSLPPDAVISTPVGGMVLWVRVPGLNSELLVQTADAEGVAIRAGSAFSSRDLYLDHFRLNIGWPLDDAVRLRLARLVALVYDQLEVTGNNVK